MSSVRLPGKVMADINGKPMLEVLLSRLSASKLVHEIVVATSSDYSDNPVAALAEELGFSVYRGSLLDVRSRYQDVGQDTKADVLVRVTGDCPLVDSQIVDELVKKFLGGDFDYASNVNPPTYPDGLDVEVFSFSSFEDSITMDTSSHGLEHVTPALRSSSFCQVNVALGEDLSHLRWTVDNPQDLEVIRKVFSHFAPRIDFGWQEVLQLYEENPKLFKENIMESRNKGQNQGTGQKLWERARRVIPGGNMLLSKRSEMFLPNQWPSYFSRSQGCRVWDLDGNEFIDMSTMGVGTNILGYRNSVVDEAVKKAIDSGTMSTLNCPEEVYLAEKLIEINPWANMVKLARTGGEANALAIRIGRAASGRDKVAVCGYHGWHDWYLAANLGDDNSLDGHLLPGLEPRGVPRSLSGSIETFLYNDFNKLSLLVAAGDIGVIKMEVVRNEEPQDGFLQKVRNLASANGIVLIFDECTSGFRETFGGIHQKYGIEPDLAVYGKALGNGFPITAVVGREDVMQAAQSTFVSSTFWSDRVGPVAALATLSEMERLKSWETVTEIGERVRDAILGIADQEGLSLKTSGRPAIMNYRLDSDLALHFKTLVTKEMLDRGFLASNSFYASISHGPHEVSNYLENLEVVFRKLAAIVSPQEYINRIGGELSHEGFRRLN